MRIATLLYLGCVCLTETALEVFALLSFFLTVHLDPLGKEAGRSGLRKDIAFCTTVM